LLTHPLSLTPPPPSYTLFPYTTLFRSEQFLQARTRPMQCNGDDAARRAQQLSNLGVAVVVLVAEYQHLYCPGIKLCHRFDEPFLDRKSTRLNSSHLGISYAVFCLKKKI